MAAAQTQADRQAQVLAAGYNGPLTDAAINQAYANAATPSDLSAAKAADSKFTSTPNLSTSPTPGTQLGAQTTVGAGTQQLQAGINQLLGAAASGNKAALDETIREFNQTFGLSTDQLNEQIRQFNQNFGISQAGVTGTYGGAPTLAAQNQQANIAAQVAGLTGTYTAPGTAQRNIAVDAFNARANPADKQAFLTGAGGNPDAAAANYWAFVQPQLAASGTDPNVFVYGPTGQPPGSQQTLAAQAQYAQLYGGSGAAPQAGDTTLAAQQQAYAQETGLVNLINQMQANPFKQQAAMGQLNQLLQGQPVAGFGQTNQVQGLGTAGQGGAPSAGVGYLTQMIQDIQSPQANQTSTQQILDAIPTPNKIDSVQFFRAPQTTQNLVLQGMQEKYGLDPADAQQQIKNTLPGFQAPSTYGTVKRPGS
jgi:hypothetical protein